MDTAAKIANLIHEGSEGGTMSVSGAEPQQADGFWVGGAVTPLILQTRAIGSDDYLESHIRGFLRKAPTGFVGWWVDGDLLFVDATDWVREQRVAEELGRHRRERAVYDIARRRDICFTYVDGE